MKGNRSHRSHTCPHRAGVERIDIRPDQEDSANTSGVRGPNYRAEVPGGLELSQREPRFPVPRRAERCLDSLSANDGPNALVVGAKSQLGKDAW